MSQTSSLLSVRERKRKKASNNSLHPNFTAHALHFLLYFSILSLSVYVYIYIFASLSLSTDMESGVESVNKHQNGPP